jgi:DNA-binding transcriptional MerR regulator
MSELRRIGELAGAAGVPTSTVRFYERRGLLPADARSPSKYRLYGDAALERLRFIRLAQSTGFTLEDIAALLDLREERAVSRSEVRAMLAARLADVRRRLSELREVEKVLKQSLDACSRGGNGDCCPVVQSLTVSASGRTKKSR